MQSRFSAFNHALQGYGLAVKASYNIKEKFLGLLVCARPMFFILTPVNAASAVVLAISGFPALTKCLIGFVAVAFASAGINAFNNYIDRERDKHIWKTRPIPSGRVEPNHVFIMVALLFAASLIMTWFFFNAVTLIILFLAI